jgi:hypothetical protein
MTPTRCTCGQPLTAATPVIVAAEFREVRGDCPTCGPYAVAAFGWWSQGRAWFADPEVVRALLVSDAATDPGGRS